MGAPKPRRFISVWGWAVIAMAAGIGDPQLFAAEVEIRIDHPPTNRAVIAVLFDSANTFVDLRDPARAVSFSPQDSALMRIPDLPGGEYALVVYQDDNGNGRLDKNFIGIPREPLGFSNRYWPQGRPTYARAAFRLEEGEIRRFDIHLRPVFGRLGLLGVGVGVLSQTSPYRGSEAVVVQPIPAISYIGDRVQIFGPTARCGIVSGGDVRLAATASYRPGAYREDDSTGLKGLGDREGTVMGGLAIQADLPGGLVLSAGYEHDLLDRNGGGLGRIGIERAFQRGILTASPQLGLHGLTAELARYEYGVPADRSREGRPAYLPGEVVEVDCGISLSVELRGSWRIIANGSVSFLPAALTRSPIVDDAHVFRGFLAVNRLF